MIDSVEQSHQRNERLLSDQSADRGSVQVTAEPAASPRDERTGDGAARGRTRGAQTAHQQTREQTGTTEGL